MHLKIKVVNESVRALWEEKAEAHVASLANEYRDSGLDIPYPEDVMIRGKEMKLTDLGIAVEAVEFEPNRSVHGYCSPIPSPSPFYIYPRSSICKTPLRLANSVGIIDSGYRGELKAPLDNTAQYRYGIKKGDRLFQICSPDLSPITFELVDELSETSRGEGGIGSTGK